MIENQKLLNWSRVHGIGMALMVVPTIMFSSVSALLIWTVCSFAYILFSHHSLFKLYSPYGGYANYVTLLRLVILLMVGFFMDYLDNYLIIAILVFVLILDGFDGYLARKFKTHSELGGSFDMETDAFFIVLLSVIIYSRGLVSWWILIPGFLRYFYVVLMAILGWDKVAEPRSNHARIIAIIVFISMFSPLLLPREFYIPITVSGTVLLIISFAWSFILLRRKMIN